MDTAEEVIAHFRSLGYPAMSFDYPKPGSVRIAGFEKIIPADNGYLAEELRLLQHEFVLFCDDLQWVVRDCNWQIHVDESFASLAKAVAALEADFTEWRASGCKPAGPGLTKPST